MSEQAWRPGRVMTPAQLVTHILRHAPHAPRSYAAPTLPYREYVALVGRTLENRLEDANGSPEEWLARRGWQREGDYLRSWFRNGRGSWRGRLKEQPYCTEFDVFIKDPPAWALDGAHSRCLKLVHNGWFALHQALPARGAVFTILGTERFLLDGGN